MKYTNIIKKEIKVMVVVVVVLLLVVLGVSYALFMQVTDNTNNQVVTTGSLQIEYASTNGYIENDTYKELLPMSNDQGLLQSGYEFSVKNTGSLPVAYNVYLYVNEEEYNKDVQAGTISGSLFDNLSLIHYNLQTNDDRNTDINILSEQTIKEENGITKYILHSDEVSSKTNTINNHKLRIWLSEDVNVAEIGKYIYLKLEVTSYVKGQEPSNSSIIVAYTYNQDSTAANYCVTGDEETCVETTCYESSDANSCASGTILDYKVNDTDTVRFHVMYDNGNTLTMQSQKNNVYGVAWISNKDYLTANTDETVCNYDTCNDEGPITALNALESKTSEWKHVNNQIYTMGTTVFKTNAYTGCSSYSSCTVNTYILPERTAKARMITVQEAFDLGCTQTGKSCPKWMYNYLDKSTSYEGTKDDSTIANGSSVNSGYLTMNAYLSNTYKVWSVDYIGYLGYRDASNSNPGVRAVVEIDK